MTLIENIAQNNVLLAAFICISLLFSEYITFSKRLYYNLPHANPQMKEHFLNRRYSLQSKGNLDIYKINRDIATVNILAILLGGCVMALIDLFYGFLLFLALKTLLTRLAMVQIGRHWDTRYQLTGRGH